MTAGRTELNLRLAGPENPFSILGLRCDADPRTVRRRLEDIEMQARLGGDDAVEAHDATRLRAAAARLSNPDLRLECELLSPWEGSGDLASLAGDHDWALGNLLSLLRQDTGTESDERSASAQPTGGRGHSNPADLLAVAITSWGALAEDGQFADAVARRRLTLGAGADPAWLAMFVSGAVLPALIRRGAQSNDSGRSLSRAAEALGHLKPSLGSDAALALTDRLVQLGPTVEGPSAVAGLLSYLQAATDTADALERTYPADSSRLRSHASDLATRAASTLFNQEHLAEAERLLSSAVWRNLNEADRVEMAANLKAIRFSRERSKAVEFARAGDWERCLSALRRALREAPNPEAAGIVRSEIATAEEALRQPQSGSGIPWRLVAVLVVGGLIAWAALADSDDSTSGTTSRSVPSPSSASSSTQSSGSTGGVTSGSQGVTRIPSSRLALDQVFDAWDALIEAENRVPQSEESPLFSSRARAAATAARDLASTARSFQSSLGSFATCGEAMALAGDLSFQYWDGLSQATRGETIDAAMWNETLDTYQSRALSAGRSALSTCQ